MKSDLTVSNKYRIRFIDSVRFTASSLSSLIDNLAERLLKDKFKDCKSRLKYITPKDSLLPFQFMDCNKKYDKGFNEDSRDSKTRISSVVLTLTNFVS